jgi:beta-glucanase (GH16 family)
MKKIFMMSVFKVCLLMQTACCGRSMSGNSESSSIESNATVSFSVISGDNNSANIQVPDGYELVWHDEFNEGSEPNTSNWYYETGAGGWGNNELQNYVKCYMAGVQLAKVSEGTLKIICQKINGTVYSIRMNTNESWKYGYFEARLKLPIGRGTWPAFWMLSKNLTSWPGDGEIDIMEEVGYEPNYVSSTIHCNAYNGGNGMQKTAKKLVIDAQTEFHVYATEWTETCIRSFVDGVEIFRYNNDGKGLDFWPYNVPFYLKLNLAWGGDWGGAQGVDESVLPATYEVDYVRVFQKK